MNRVAACASVRAVGASRSISALAAAAIDLAADLQRNIDSVGRCGPCACIDGDAAIGRSAGPGNGDGAAELERNGCVLAAVVAGGI